MVSGPRWLNRSVGRNVLRHLFRHRGKSTSRLLCRRGLSTELLEGRTLLDADLAIFKLDDPDPVGAGSNLTYTLTVRNLGLSDAANVVVTDELPPGVSFVSAVTSQGLCSEEGGTVACHIDMIGGGGIVSETGSGAVIIDGGDRDDHGFVQAGEDAEFGTEDDLNESTDDDEIVTLGLASGSAGIGGSATITIVVNVPLETINGTVLTNRATATSSTADSNLENNEATEQTTVAGGVEEPPDIVVQSFASGGAGQLGQLRIDYEILDSIVPEFAFGILNSTGAFAAGGDLEVGPRISVTNPADRTVGSHSILFDGLPYAVSIADLDVSFVLAVADIGMTVLETDETNNDANFVGVFHRPASAAPLVVRGRDDTDRNTGDDPADDLLFRTVGGKGGFDVEISGSFGIMQVPAAEVSEIRVLGLGGDDRIDGACGVSQPLLARGGTGDDMITSTRGGGDLFGEEDDDRLASCEGNDHLDGGEGRDTADFGAALTGVIVNLPARVATSDSDDRLVEIENILGSTHPDHITGDEQDNFLFGDSGADTIFGGTGSDTIDGGSSDDELHGDNGIANQGDDDLMNGSGGNDQVIGDGGHDTIFGGIGNDFLCGHFGDDSIWGEDGDDTVIGDQGDDHLSGGANDDLVLGGDGMDSVFGNDGDDILSGGRDRDLIDAGDGTDIIFGNRRQDTIILTRRRRRGDRVLPE